MEYKATKFNFNFFLPNKAIVNSLEEGAIQYGGATKVKDEIYSNCGGMDIIHVNDDNNEIAIFIPSTINMDVPIGNYPYLAKAYSTMYDRFSNLEIIADCKGSWYCDTLQKTIIEDITIVKAYCEELTEDDILYVTKLAEEIKRDMSQEGVSISINNALAIV